MKTFLEECVSVGAYAKRHNKCAATGYTWVKRGLPVMDALGKMAVHIPTADAWLQGQTRSKNSPQAGK